VQRAADRLAEQLAEFPGVQMAVPQVADLPAVKMAVPQAADPPAVEFADLPAEQLVELADPLVGQVAAVRIDRMVAAHRLLPSHPTEDRQRVRCEYELETRVSWN
jgi:hypothetical protein